MKRVQMRTRTTNPTRACDWMTIDDLAKYIGQPKSVIYQLTSAKKIPYYRPSKRLLFKQTEIDQWIESSKCNTNSISELLTPVTYENTNN